MHEVTPVFIFLVEDQKEIAVLSPELRQKEVKMSFLNQLTSVFNPRSSSSPASAHTQVSISFSYSYTLIGVGKV